MAIAVTGRITSGDVGSNITYVTLGSTPTAGAAILVSLGTQSTADSILQVFDNKGNTYTRVYASSIHTNVLLRTYLYMCPSQRGLASGDQIIIVAVNGTIGVYGIDEATGIGSAHLPDVSAEGFSASDVATFSSGATGTPAYANELCWSIIATEKNGGTQSITPDAGWTQIGTRETNTNISMYNMYRIISAAAAQTASGAINTQSDNYVAFVATFPDPQTPPNDRRAASAVGIEVDTRFANRGASFVAAELTTKFANRGASFVGVEVAGTITAPPPASTRRRPPIIVA